jgi:hypothetical protein
MKLDYRLIILDDHMLRMELGALRKHLSQLGESAFDKGLLANVMTSQGVGAHHDPIDIIRDILEKRLSISILQALEYLTNVVFLDSHL